MRFLEDRIVGDDGSGLRNGKQCALPDSVLKARLRLFLSSGLSKDAPLDAAVENVDITKKKKRRKEAELETISKEPTIAALSYSDKACAACGIRLLYNTSYEHSAKTANEKRVFRTDDPDFGLPLNESCAPYRQRGIVIDKVYLNLIKCLVQRSDTYDFFLCESCETIYKKKLKSLKQSDKDQPNVIPEATNSDNVAIKVPKNASKNAINRIKAHQNMVAGSMCRHPAIWRTDFGIPFDLPVLSEVEKACIAQVRLYGKIIKMVHGRGGVESDAGVSEACRVPVPNVAVSYKLTGHIIAFPQSGAPSAIAARSLDYPRIDAGDVIRVHFIGNKTHWAYMMPQLSKCPKGPLNVRLDVLVQWLRVLKRTHRHYANVNIDESHKRQIQLDEMVAEILDSALISDDEKTYTMEEKTSSNVANQTCSGGANFTAAKTPSNNDNANSIDPTKNTPADESPPIEILGFSSIGIENQDIELNTEAIYAQYKKTLNIEADKTKPLNEFEQNEEILTLAFPFIFMFGSIGVERGMCSDSLAEESDYNDDDDDDNDGNKKKTKKKMNSSQESINNQHRKRILMHHDRRCDSESTLIFYLFNQMQRHRATQNGVRADQRDIEELNVFMANPATEILLYRALNDREEMSTVPEVERARRLLKRILHVGDVGVPFSRGEMDRAWININSVIRWRGSPLVFLTISPSIIDNSYGLSVCTGDTTFHTKSYEMRSRVGFENPISSALFFRTVIDMLLHDVIKAPLRTHKKTRYISELEPGVFGRCHNYAMTIECQGRSLLHAHILLFCETSPEYIQQVFRLRLEESMKKIIAFIDDVQVTHMQQDFWNKSEQAWANYDRVLTPGLFSDTPPPRHQAENNTEISGAAPANPAPNTAAATTATQTTEIVNSACWGPVGPENRLFYNVHLYQLHRMHRATCFKYMKNENSRSFKIRCRMAMPAGYWPHPTQMIGIHLHSKKESLVLKDKNRARKQVWGAAKTNMRRGCAVGLGGRNDESEACTAKNGTVRKTVVFRGGGSAQPDGCPSKPIDSDENIDENTKKSDEESGADDQNEVPIDKIDWSKLFSQSCKPKQKSNTSKENQNEISTCRRGKDEKSSKHMPSTAAQQQTNHITASCNQQQRQQHNNNNTSRPAPAARKEKPITKHKDDNLKQESAKSRKRPCEDVRVLYLEDLVGENAIQCAHVFLCRCQSMRDLYPSARLVYVIEGHRPTKNDMYIVPFTKYIIKCFNCNTASIIITSAAQAATTVIYMVKYNTKDKTTAANVYSTAIAARSKINAFMAASDSATRSNPRSKVGIGSTTARAPPVMMTYSERTFFNILVNCAAYFREIAATMAAYALQGHPSAEISDIFWYLFPWDPISKLIGKIEVEQGGHKPAETAKQSKNSNAETGEKDEFYDYDDGENRDDTGVIIRKTGSGYAQPNSKDIGSRDACAGVDMSGAVFDDNYIENAGEARAKVVTLSDGSCVAATQADRYINRSEKLEDLSLLEFELLMQFDKKPKGFKKEGQEAEDATAAENMTEHKGVLSGVKKPRHETKKSGGVPVVVSKSMDENNPRFDFINSFLNNEYLVRLRNKYPVPVLAGLHSPTRPSGDTLAAQKQRNKWAYYYMILLFPWRDPEQFLGTVTTEMFEHWLVAALRGEYGKVERGKALFVSSCTFGLSLRSDNASKISSKWRNRDAAMAEIRNGKWSVVTSHASYNERRKYMGSGGGDCVGESVDETFPPHEIERSVISDEDVDVDEIDRFYDDDDDVDDDKAAVDIENEARNADVDISIMGCVLSAAARGRHRRNAEEVCIGRGEQLRRMIDEAKQIQKQQDDTSKTAAGNTSGVPRKSFLARQLHSSTSVCNANTESYRKAIEAVREYSAQAEQTAEMDVPTQRIVHNTGLSQMLDEELRGTESSKLAPGDMSVNFLEDDLSLNSDQNIVRRAILETVHLERQLLLYVQGEAGTGKSFMISSVVRDVNAICKNPQSVACMSFTGVATENLTRGSLTIHKAFCMSVKCTASLEQLEGKQLELFVERFKNTRVFVIDEISMVPPQLFSRIGQRLQQLAREVWSIRKRELIRELDLINGNCGKYSSNINDENANEHECLDDNDASNTYTVNIGATPSNIGGDKRPLTADISSRKQWIEQQLRRSCPSNEHFGGYTVIIAGDFRQIPPVSSTTLMFDSQYDAKAAKNTSSVGGFLFRHFKYFELKIQMRALEPVQQQRVTQLRDGSITTELIDSIQQLSAVDFVSSCVCDFNTSANPPPNACHDFVLNDELTSLKLTPTRKESFLKTNDCENLLPVQKTERGSLAKRNFLESVSQSCTCEGNSFVQDATFMVQTNKERNLINDYQGQTFALKNGVPVIKWRNPLYGRKALGLNQDATNILYDGTPELESTFVCGAPGMITLNINPACGLSNGSSCTLVSIGSGVDECVTASNSLLDASDTQSARAPSTWCSGLPQIDIDAINAAGPGEVVWLSEAPKYILVHVDALDQLDVRAQQENNNDSGTLDRIKKGKLYSLFNQDLRRKCDSSSSSSEISNSESVGDNDIEADPKDSRRGLLENNASPNEIKFLLGSCGRRVIPITQCRDHVMLESNADVGAAKTPLYFLKHSVDLAFAVTLHKVQGKTLRKAVLCVDEYTSAKISFEMLLVALTRVRNGGDLRIMPSLRLANGFKFLTDLQPNKDVTAWFNGEFVSVPSSSSSSSLILHSSNTENEMGETVVVGGECRALQNNDTSRSQRSLMMRIYVNDLEPSKTPRKPKRKKAPVTLSKTKKKPNNPDPDIAQDGCLDEPPAINTLPNTTSTLQDVLAKLCHSLDKVKKSPERSPGDDVQEARKMCDKSEAAQGMIFSRLKSNGRLCIKPRSAAEPGQEKEEGYHPTQTEQVDVIHETQGNEAQEVTLQSIPIIQSRLISNESEKALARCSSESHDEVQVSDSCFSRHPPKAPARKITGDQMSATVQAHLKDFFKVGKSKGVPIELGTQCKRLKTQLQITKFWVDKTILQTRRSPPSHITDDDNAPQVEDDTQRRSLKRLSLKLSPTPSTPSAATEDSGPLIADSAASAAGTGESSCVQSSLSPSVSSRRLFLRSPVIKADSSSKPSTPRKKNSVAIARRLSLTPSSPQITVDNAIDIVEETSDNDRDCSGDQHSILSKYLSSREAKNERERDAKNMRKNGSFLSSSVLDAACTQLVPNYVTCENVQMLLSKTCVNRKKYTQLTPREFKNITAALAASGQGNPCVYTVLFYDNHFIAVKINVIESKIFYRNSLKNYSKTSKNKALQNLSQVFIEYSNTILGKKTKRYSTIEIQTDQQNQNSNDCGIYSVNNILNWANINKTFTRQTLVSHWLSSNYI